MDLTENQQYYFDKIRNSKLRELLKSSFSFFSMPDEEKDEFLIWLSQIHLDKKAEKEAIEQLSQEKDETIRLAKEVQKKKLTDEDNKRVEEVINQEYTAMKEDIKNLKKEVRTEQEKGESRKEEKELKKLLTKLDKA